MGSPITMALSTKHHKYSAQVLGFGLCGFRVWGFSVQGLRFSLRVGSEAEECGDWDWGEAGIEDLGLSSPSLKARRGISTCSAQSQKM